MNFNKPVLLFLLFLGLNANAQRDSVVIAKPISQYPPELLKTDEYGNKYYYDDETYIIRPAKSAEEIVT